MDLTDDEWTDNNCEVFTHTLKQIEDWKSKPLTEVASYLNDILDGHFKDLRRAFMRMVIHKYVTNPREQSLTYRHTAYTTTSASSQKSPSRGYKSYASISPTNRHQEFPRVVEANQGSGIKQPDSRGYQPRKINCSIQPQELQQTSTTMGHKDHPVSSGKINKCSQNDITTSSNPDIKDTFSTFQSNVTCGSCGGKGHTRKWKSCPNYYTVKESARREVHGERRRQKMQIQEMFLIIILCILRF